MDFEAHASDAVFELRIMTVGSCLFRLGLGPMRTDVLCLR